MGDAVAFTYRKDWFARPELQAEFKQKHSRDLAPPKTWDEFKQVAQFFQNRTIDGKKVYGAALYTERGSEGITMGVTNTLYAYGFEYANPAKPYDMKGYVNGPGAVKGLKFYKELYDCCTPPGHSNAYMTEDLDAYKSGQVAMQMNFIAFFPGISKDPQVGGEKTGFFPIPKGDKQLAQLGGQGISVVKYSDKKEMALRVHEVVRAAGRPEEVVGRRRLHLPEVDPGSARLRDQHAVRQGVPGLDEDRQGLLGRARATRSCCWPCKTACMTTSSPARARRKAALDALLKDWTEVFKEDGKLK